MITKAQINKWDSIKLINCVCLCVVCVCLCGTYNTVYDWVQMHYCPQVKVRVQLQMLTSGVLPCLMQGLTSCSLLHILIWFTSLKASRASLGPTHLLEKPQGHSWLHLNPGCQAYTAMLSPQPQTCKLSCNKRNINGVKKKKKKSNWMSICKPRL